MGQRSCNVRAVGLPISVKTAKNKGLQNHICCDCRRQFIDAYEPKGYTDEIKRECLEMYVNGMGFRAIERVKKVHHTTVINWVKQVGTSLPDAPEYSEIPEVAELDELETFVAALKTRFGYGRQ